LVVDSDAPTIGQVRDDESLSLDAAIDTLRVDFLAAGEIYARDTFVAPELDDWPLSFAVRAPAELSGRQVRLRLRAFRADLAMLEDVEGVRELRPQAGASIDRVVELTLPERDVVPRHITLSLACIGRSPRFVSPANGCIDGDRPDALATEGVDEDDRRDVTAVGTSPLARQVDCVETSKDGRVCIPGGLFLMGDDEIVGVAGLPQDDPVPLRPVYLAPFWLDRTELSVASFAEQAGGLTTPSPLPYDASVRPWCTWQAPDDGFAGDRPINCVAWETAAQLCELRGGRLPSEAEWEHAGSGRGQGRRYPWGCSGTGRQPSSTELQRSERRVARRRARPRRIAGGVDARSLHTVR
jgi:hypothetical protein